MQLRIDRGVPNIVLIGVPHIKALRRVLAKLQSASIPHYAWTEPDGNMGFTSIITAPLYGEHRQILKDYRVYAPVAQLRERSALNGEAVGENPTGCAKGEGAEAGEAVGENPTGCAKGEGAEASARV